MMKAAVCSWLDMRRVRRILAERERLNSEYEALSRCADKRTGDSCNVEAHFEDRAHLEARLATEKARAEAAERALAEVKDLCSALAEGRDRLQARLEECHTALAEVAQQRAALVGRCAPSTRRRRGPDSGVPSRFPPR
jgi:predicted RNase H-like nuclease (RuvC/YqgF family)